MVWCNSNGRDYWPVLLVLNNMKNIESGKFDFKSVIEDFGKLNQELYGINPYADMLERDQENEDNSCEHMCSGNCRREGCNCECGEWHETPEQRKQRKIEEKAEMQSDQFRGN